MDPLVLGIATATQLLALGWTRWQIDDAVARGSIERLRRGWFALDAPEQARAAVRAGGCISCFSALAHRSVWVPERQHRDHVRIVERRRGRRRGCTPYGNDPRIRTALDDVSVALRCAARCGSAEELVVVMDSLVHLGLTTIAELTSCLADAPERVRRLVHRVDPASEAGTETMVRLRLRALGVAVRTQVWLSRSIRVDLLVGDRLVIECDSVEHHTSREAYERDRARDRSLVARGYIVVRLTYRQIHDDWPAIEAHILALVRARKHLDRRLRLGTSA